jgi:Tol biopolymer transport system component
MAACSGGDDDATEQTSGTTPATVPETTPYTGPAPPTTADTTTTIIDTTIATTIATTTVEPTTTLGEQPAPAAWEPFDPASGDWLAFTSSRTGQGELWAIEVESGEERQLTDELGDIYQPAWAPDGSAIAFSCPNTGPEVGPESGVGGSDICVLTLATGEVTYLTDDPWGDQSPTWSPDSTTLAFLTFGEDGVGRVRSIDVAGGGEPVVVSEGGGPAWSPDGSVLAIVGPGGELVAIDRASGDRRVLAESGYPFSSLAWSPDGSEIAFSCASGERGPDDFLPPTDICVIAADGSSPRAIEYGGANDAGPVWSPDGTAILFTSSNFSTGQSDVVVASGSGAPRPIASGSSPAVSPDGLQIAVIAPDGGGIQLIDESGATSLISVDPTAGEPKWAPAG